jgi:predicted AAA+ superfamily ATPase
MDIKRHLFIWALSDKHLHGRMSFIAGPRQIGKTTGIKNFLSSVKQEKLYYNWDAPTVKRRFAQNPIFFVEDLPSEIPQPWLAIDEIHKYPKWKNILKGYYDEWKERIKFIVMGSARLDFFRKTGDSLVGRYFLFKMFPLGIKEVLNRSLIIENTWSPEKNLKTIPLADSEAFEKIKLLLEISGFPEPFTVGTDSFTTRWRENHISLIINEDLRDLTKIAHIKKLETLLYILPEKIGSPLSLNALKQTLESAHGSISLWLEALKKVYLIFSIPPWTAKLSRAVRKEEKYYFWDWGMVQDFGARFENFIAVQLERAVAAWNEWGRGTFKLHYLRTKDGREVDFVVADRQKAYLLVEVKTADETLSPHLPYFQEKTGASLAIQVINKKQVCTQKGKNLWVMGADRFLMILP